MSRFVEHEQLDVVVRRLSDGSTVWDVIEAETGALVYPAINRADAESYIASVERGHQIASVED